MNIVFFDVEKWERDSFDSLQPEHAVRYSEEPLRAGNAGEHASAEGISIFIYSKVDRQVERILKATTENIRGFVTGSPVNVVTPTQ